MKVYLCGPIEEASKERAFHKAALDHIADVCANALSPATGGNTP